MTSSEKETPTDRNFRQNAKCNILGRPTLGYKYTGRAWSQRIVCFFKQNFKTRNALLQSEYSLGVHVQRKKMIDKFRKQNVIVIVNDEKGLTTT